MYRVICTHKFGFEAVNVKASSERVARNVAMALFRNMGNYNPMLNSGYSISVGVL